jgi:hypothetical protein
MNERIQELAVKAKLMAEEDINKQISYNAELKAFAEKFAELIVKECAAMTRNLSPHGELAEKAVKEHFGVGMSTEDKKTLIKELLGVKND